MEMKSRGAGGALTEGAPEVVAAGRGWIALDKPAGMSVHNDPGEDLISCLKQRLGSDAALAAACGFQAGDPIQPVHRLDRDTSGLVLAAVAPGAVRDLMAAFAARQVVKTYLAVAHGNLGNPGGQGRWDHPLSHGPGGRRRPAGPPPHRDARTGYRVLAQGNGFTLLICRPETGRKHQIRRHACLAGHPLAGDRRYGPEARAAALARQGFRRLALHAWRLEISLPGEGRPRVLESGRAPAAMLALVGGEGAPANLDAVGRGQWD